jgi:hypothetical protein
MKKELRFSLALGDDLKICETGNVQFLAFGSLA